MQNMSPSQAQVDAIDIEQTLAGVIENLRNFLATNNRAEPCCVGIHTGGVWLAHRIAAALSLPDPVGELDASLYRDDYDRKGLHAGIRPSTLPFSIDERDVILVDDILMTGRTVRAAMNLLFDYGRPASICLVTLLDAGKRELPLQADVSGSSIALPEDTRVKLEGPETLRLVLHAQGDAQ